MKPDTRSFYADAVQQAIEIKEMPELHVAAVHHVGPHNQIPDAFGRLGSIAARAGLFQLAARR